MDSVIELISKAITQVKPTDWAAALAGLGSLNPTQAQPSQAAEMPEFSNTKRMRILSRRIADQPQASVFDTSTPAVPFVPANDVFSLDRRNSSFSDAYSRAGAPTNRELP